MLDIEALERRGEAVGIALAPHFAIRDDIDPRALHIGNREPRGIVLRLLQIRLGHTPDVACPHAWWQAVTEILAVHQPVWLRIAANDRRHNTFAHTSPVCSI